MKPVNGKKIQTSVILLFIVCAVVWFWHPLLSWGQGPMQSAAPAAPWRPNQFIKDARFVGPDACAQCHVEEAADQHNTSMGRALERVSDCQILSTHPRLTFRTGPYSYQIVRQGKQSIYSVTDGTNTISEPILYCFGQGKAGQTYIFRHDGSFYESRVSYYKEIQNLDVTIGYPRSAPPSLEEALGRAISMDEARSCFSCHSTASVSGSELKLDHLMPGVSCEACHGPGEKHIAAVKAGAFKTGDFKNLQIFNPGRMDADDMTQEFCGSCHRSAEQVTFMPQRLGINNVRFQPYRIFNSRGHNTGDPRISCVACHNPHENLQHDTVFYDSKCLACHLSSTKAVKTEVRSAPACPVSSRQCVTCHMPKVELPGSHFKFTDHRIRIVRANEPYPN